MSAWNDDRVSLLKKLWTDGLSASQIASRLGGGITRNAVIGKRIRVGLPDRSPRQNAQSRAERKKRPKPFVFGRRIAPRSGELAVEQMQREAFRAEPDLFIPPEQRRSLLDLEPGDCRWAYGSGTKDDPFYFCNRLQAGSQSRAHRGALPYCDHHRRRAYDPPRPRRYPQWPAPATVAEKENA